MRSGPHLTVEDLRLQEKSGKIGIQTPAVKYNHAASKRRVVAETTLAFQMVTALVPLRTAAPSKPHFAARLAGRYDHVTTDGTEAVAISRASLTQYPVPALCPSVFILCTPCSRD